MDSSYQVINRIGGFGQGPGVFRLPFGFDIGKDNKLYVVDAYNGRIQILSSDGDFLQEFPINKSTRSIAVLNKREIVINDSKNKNVYTVLSSNGGSPKFFGEQINDIELQKFIEKSITNKKEKNNYLKQLRNEYNIAHVQVDRENNIYILAYAFPILRKFSPEGRLLKEVKFQSPHIDIVAEDARVSLRAHVAKREIGIRFVCQDFVVSNSDAIIITYRNDAGKIIFVDQKDFNYSEYTLKDKDKNVISAIGVCYVGKKLWLVTSGIGTYRFKL